jgi:AcrR family transcriptional regulator
MHSLFVAAEQVFAEVGYEQATTNLIAERASASPGTLYQFYPNKQAIAEVIALDYAARISELTENSIRPEWSQMPLRTLIDRVLDPFLSFHQTAPAFEALFLASSVSADLRKRIEALSDAAIGRLVRMLRMCAPDRSESELRCIAEVCIMAYRGVLPLLRSRQKKQRMNTVKEFKALLERYLKPVIGK